MLAEHLHQKNAMLAIVVNEDRGWGEGARIQRTGIRSVLKFCSTAEISYILE